MEFVKNVSSLMQSQGISACTLINHSGTTLHAVSTALSCTCIYTGEATLASYKNGGNGHRSSDANNDEAVVPNNGHNETRQCHG